MSYKKTLQDLCISFENKIYYRENKYISLELISELLSYTGIGQVWNVQINYKGKAILRQQHNISNQAEDLEYVEELMCKQILLNIFIFGITSIVDQIKE